MSRGWLLGGAVLLGALLIASVAVALMKREESLPEGTPGATVQSFLLAVEAEEYTLAHGLLAEDLKAECALDQFFGTARPPESRLKNDRVTLERTKTVDDTAFVTVRITRFHGSGPFGASESSFEERFTLRREAGQWRFSEYPWPFFSCGPYKPEQPRRPARVP